MLRCYMTSGINLVVVIDPLLSRSVNKSVMRCCHNLA